MASKTPPPPLWRLVAGLLAGCCLAASGLQAQSRSTGTLVGRMLDDRGAAVPDAALTLTRGVTIVRIGATDGSGRFALEDIRPGDYALLAEQVGYQPRRITGIRVLAGEISTVIVVVTRRPPPITSVDEGLHVGAGPADGATAIIGRGLEALPARAHATDLVGDFAIASRSGDARGSGLLSANGLAPRHARLVVDGLDALLLRHPGLPSESGTAPAIGRGGLSQARLHLFTLDGELPAAPGGLLELVSRAGSDRTRFEPRGWWSGASLGSAADDNPADSSATSWQAGLVAAGPIRGDTAGWSIDIDYRDVASPGAAPFTRDAAIASVVAFSADEPVVPWLAPTVRRWSGGSGSGRVALPVGHRGLVSTRLAIASWEETNPMVGNTLSNGAGTTLEASDLSAALAAEFRGDEWQSITRVGLQRASRDWTTVGVPYTTFATDGVAIGAHPSVAGSFEESFAVLSQTLIAPSGNHRLSAGGSVGRRQATYDWLANGSGTAAFGAGEDLATGLGSWSRARTVEIAPELALFEYTFFVQDAWRVTPALRFSFGIRFEGQTLPDVITADADVAAAFGLVNTTVPTDRSSGVSPRLGMSWDPGQRGRTVVHAAAGLVPGRHDLAALAEVALHDGGVEVEQATGAIGWPTAPENPVLGKRITLFNTGVRAPRALHVTGGIRHAVAPGTVVSVTGGFQHTDYLLRRDDINLPPGPLATTHEDRPVYGALTQFGGLIVPQAGSNRRVDGFDHVWGLSSTGYSEQQYATVAVEHHATGGLSVVASYAWSRTEDNLIGQLSGDPADRVTPFVGRVEDWSDGRSDLDVPHRVVVRAGYQAPGNGPLSLAARWRWRSGLPYTPGFPPGVDINGDGSSRNDPVGLQSVEGLGGLLSGAGCDAGGSGFAPRNVCREDAVHALDLGLGIRLPIGGARRLVLSVDAFNVVASATGIVDRAAVLVDPERGITTDPDGRLRLPLVRNDHFGELSSRRTAPRTIRFGLRVEH